MTEIYVITLNSEGQQNEFINYDYVKDMGLIIKEN